MPRLDRMNPNLRLVSGILLLWYASCCVSIRQYLVINWSVYTTTFTVNKINTTVPTFVFYMRMLLYRYMFRPFYWVILRRVQYTL
jgi:hypothetical protein